jgi:hypothetical protein
MLIQHPKSLLQREHKHILRKKVNYKQYTEVRLKMRK